jgi:hypothetical protein
MVPLVVVVESVVDVEEDTPLDSEDSVLDCAEDRVESTDDMPEESDDSAELALAEREGA